MSDREDAVHYWEDAFLGTDAGSQAALRFNHPNREADFPSLYRLLEPHPLRRLTPTHAGDPEGRPRSFKDYVLTIRKTSDFMERWQEVGSRTATPTDDVSSNQVNGVCPRRSPGP